MAWDTGTITSATPHSALSTKIKALFGGTGVANWSFVENVPAGVGTGQSGSASYSVDVYKCAGSGGDANDAGTDWYIGLRIPVTDGAVASAVQIMEVYNPIASGSNKGQIKRWCAANGLSTAPTGAGYWASDTFATFNAAFTPQATPTLNTSGFTYYIKLTKNLLWVSVRVGATESSWGGMLLDSFVVNVTDTCPLIGGATLISTFSNLPGGANAVASEWNVLTKPWTQGPALGTDNATNDNDLWQSNKIHVARVLAYSQAAATSWYQTGGLRGLLKSDILCFKTGGTVALGDTMSIGGNTWTVIGTTNTMFPTSGAVYYITRAN